MARKKQKIKKKLEKPAEIDGWKVGDMAWAKLVTGEQVYGEITTLHHTHQIMGVPPVDYGSAVTIMSEPDKKHRCVLSSTLQEKASAKAQKALARKMWSASVKMDKKK